MVVLNNRGVRLFLVSVIFMAVFQLEARLFSYVYLFHEGLLLIQAMLIGGGFFLLLRLSMPTKFTTLVQRYGPLLILGTFLLQQFVFFNLNHFLVDFLALSVVFGFIFIEIANCISIESSRFYAIELLGSFFGVLLYVIGVLWVLEEYLLIGVAVILLLYALVYTQSIAKRPIVLGAAAVVTGVFVVILSSTSIPVLMKCNEGGTSYDYKSACLDDRTGLVPTASFTHLKGRSDIYLRDNSHGIPFLEVKNFGYRVSAANQEELRSEEWFGVLEHRIPKLAYPSDARVMSVGAGAGSYVQALYDYIENPNITAVEIDRTVEDIYQSGLFEEYLPSLDSYEIIYDEGRRYITFSDESYDVITIAIEGINSDFPEYVDERTGLLYTKEAFETYVSRLNRDGSLVLEQYYPRGPAGDGMAVKFLKTLQTATGDSDEVFARNIFIYSWAFHRNPNAQRYIAAVYKPEGFSVEDLTTIQGWIFQIQSTDLGKGLNPHRITTLHSPADFGNKITFDTYFDLSKRQQVEQISNTEITSDNKPFRHLVTTLPFPPFSYTIFLLLTAGLIFLVARLIRQKVIKNIHAVSLSAGMGVITFSLQYLLFYKTAAFLHFNLIFFSIFLLLPLLFGAVGGYYATKLSPKYNWVLMVLIGVLALTLLTVDIFAAPRWLIFTLIAGLFVLAGFLFPRVLSLSQNEQERGVIYAINIVAGGIALMIVITAHALVGWDVLFIIVSIFLAVSLWLVQKIS